MGADVAVYMPPLCEDAWREFEKSQAWRGFFVEIENVLSAELATVGVEAFSYRKTSDAGLSDASLVDCLLGSELLGAKLVQLVSRGKEKDSALGRLHRHISQMLSSQGPSVLRVKPGAKPAVGTSKRL